MWFSLFLLCYAYCTKCLLCFLCFCHKFLLIVFYWHFLWIVAEIRFDTWCFMVVSLCLLCYAYCTKCLLWLLFFAYKFLLIVFYCCFCGLCDSLCFYCVKLVALNVYCVFLCFAYKFLLIVFYWYFFVFSLKSFIYFVLCVRLIAQNVFRFLCFVYKFLFFMLYWKFLWIVALIRFDT